MIIIKESTAYLSFLNCLLLKNENIYMNKNIAGNHQLSHPEHPAES